MPDLEKWQRALERSGMCLPSTLTDMLHRFNKEAKAGRAKVVHGWCFSPKENRMIKHAWLVVDGKTWEPTVERFLPPTEVKRLRMKAVKSYSLVEICQLSLKTGWMGGDFEF